MKNILNHQNKMDFYKNVLLSEKSKIYKSIDVLNRKIMTVSNQYLKKQYFDQIDVLEFKLEQINSNLVKHFSHDDTILNKIQKNKNSINELEYLLNNNKVDKLRVFDLLSKKMDQSNFLNEVILNKLASGNYGGLNGVDSDKINQILDGFNATDEVIESINKTINDVSKNFLVFDKKLNAMSENHENLKNDLTSQIQAIDNKLDASLSEAERMSQNEKIKTIYIEQPILINDDPLYNNFESGVEETTTYIQEPLEVEKETKVVSEEYIPQNTVTYEMPGEPIIETTTTTVEDDNSYYDNQVDSNNEYYDDNMFYDDDVFDAAFE